MANEISLVQAFKVAAVDTALPWTEADIGAAGPITDWTGAAAVNEVQTLTITGSPTGGTFTVTYDLQETGSIPYDAAADVVEGFLEALSSIGEGNISVTGSAGGPWACEFINDLAGTDVDAMTTDNALLTGGSTPDVTVTETTAGAAATGTWANFASDIDAEPGVQIAWEEIVRKIRVLGGKAPRRKHIIRSVPTGITVMCTEADVLSIAQYFPSATVSGAGYTVTFGGQESVPDGIAAAIETSLGVDHFYNLVPAENQEIILGDDEDITMHEVLFECFEDDSGNVGEIIFFNTP